MKKILALILSLCLLCGATAFATEIIDTTTVAESTVTYTVTTPELKDEFVVVIPSAINIDATSKTATESVTLQANPTLVSGTQIWVYLKSTENNFKLKSGENELAYKIEMNNSTYTDNSNLSDASVMGWHVASVTEDKTQDITFTVTDQSTVAGTYTDKVTFSIEIK